MSLLRKKIAPLVFFWSSMCCFAGHLTWPEDPYSYYANNSSLVQVCEDFAAGFGLSIKVSQKVHGTLSGRLSATSPTIFLNRLASMYGLTWFVDSGILYVNSAEESASRSIRVPNGTAAQIHQALMSLGILDPRFGWGTLAEQNIVMVSGPPPYLDLVERTIKALPIAAGGIQVAVFHIKHASVLDRTIAYRDQQLVSPGLATILQQLLSGSNKNSIDLLQSPEVRRDAQQLRDDISRKGQKISLGKEMKGEKPGSVRPKEYSGPSIQADPRTNSIIISDFPERMPMYEKLIKELDIPMSLIQIQVTIIDLDARDEGELGINWSAGGDGVGISNGLTPGGISGNDIGVAIGPSGVSVNPTTLVVSSANYLLARVRALESRGDAAIQSSPSVLTTENMGAVLDYSSTFYIQTTGERVANVTPETVGTTLKVTPHLIRDGSSTGIKLTIDIQNGSITEQSINGYPVVQNSTVSTEAIVHEHESLLVGGFYYDHDESLSGGIPILGRLPIFGRIFSHSRHKSERRKRLFLIQPTILNSEPVPVPRVENVRLSEVSLPKKLEGQVLGAPDKGKRSSSLRRMSSRIEGQEKLTGEPEETTLTVHRPGDAALQKSRSSDGFFHRRSQTPQVVLLNRSAAEDQTPVNTAQPAASHLVPPSSGGSYDHAYHLTGPAGPMVVQPVPSEEQPVDSAKHEMDVLKSSHNFGRGTHHRATHRGFGRGGVSPHVVLMNQQTSDAEPSGLTASSHHHGGGVGKRRGHGFHRASQQSMNGHRYRPALHLRGDAMRDWSGEKEANQAKPSEGLLDL